MLFVCSVGVTLLTMAYLERKGKISINHHILYLLIGIFAVWCGWWGLEKIADAFLLNITK